MQYISINKLLTKSIYKQIADSIETAIEQGTLIYNDKLPTEKEICNAFSISQTAVKMAYETLINKGLIKRIKGKGTYITNRTTYYTDIHSFFHIEQTNKTHQQIVLIERTNKDISAMRELGLQGMQKYYHIMRIYYSERNPVLLQRAYLPEHLFVDLQSKSHQDKNLYDIIEEEYNHPINELKSTFNPYNASASDALLLNIEADDALYLVRSKIIDPTNQILAYVCNYYPGEFTQFEVIVHAE